MDATLAEIAEWVEGRVDGQDSLSIAGVSALHEAGPSDIAFVSDESYWSAAASSGAGALLVSEDFPKGKQPLIRVANPRAAMALLLKRVEGERRTPPEGIHPAAVISPNVTLGDRVSVDANVRICSGAVIGDGTVLYANSYIGHDVVIGADCFIYSTVTIRERVVIGARCIIHPAAVIGGDGFGFTEVDGKREKIPQVGTVVIEDDVEIGSNTCIDRATMGTTRIGAGTKIDNLCQIAHNCDIGPNCTISGMTGLAGSTVLGAGVTVGANVGFAGHLTVGDGATIAGRAGVTKSVPAGAVVSGFPAVPHEESQRILAAGRRMPEALKRLRALEQQLEQLERSMHGTPENAG